MSLHEIQCHPMKNQIVQLHIQKERNKKVSIKTLKTVHEAIHQQVH